MPVARAAPRIRAFVEDSSDSASTWVRRGLGDVVSEQGEHDPGSQTHEPDGDAHG